MNFKLTYATMFNPPAEMHTRFDAALSELNRSLGATHPLYINGEDRVVASHDTRTVLLTSAASLSISRSPVSMMRTTPWQPRKLPSQAGAQHRCPSVRVCLSASRR